MSQSSGTDQLLPQRIVLKDFEPQTTVLGVNKIEGPSVSVGKVTSFGQDHFEEGIQIFFSGESYPDLAQALNPRCLIASEAGVADWCS